MARLVRLRFLLAALMLGAVVATGAISSAQEAGEEPRYDKAQRYFQHENKVFHCIAQDILEELIAEGETHHALELFRRYKNGDGLPESPRQAFYWIVYAVMNGYPEAIDLDELERLKNETTRIDQLIVRNEYLKGRHLPCG